MTLNITVATPRCIYQSADYRLKDTTTGKTFASRSQKIVLVNTYRWSATVCFSGVGRTHKLDVGEWLAERVAAIQFDDPFEHLVEELLKADDWLSAIPAPHNRHSFSVGAFVGSEPLFALFSNFEQPSGLRAATASAKLSVYPLRPAEPKTFVSGRSDLVREETRTRLATLAAGDPEPQRMYSALAEVNRDVALRTDEVSTACFTAHVRLTGEGGGCVHDPDNRHSVPAFHIPGVAQEAIRRLAEKQFGPGRWSVVSMATSRAEASEEYHETQLREKPKDPGVHSNYGVFLKEKKGDLEGAEREYRRAIELDANHVNGLGNLANLLSEKGHHDEAAGLYRSALEADPGNENVTWNYARFLVREYADRSAALEVLDRGIATHPESGRLLLLQAEQCLLDGATSEALEGYRRAREKGADQPAVEAGYACALQLSGAPIGECIGAYRVALALNPQNGALILNLAQLLFINGDGAEANRRLYEALRLELDESAQLEAQFYLLCHTSSDPAAIFRKTKSLLTRRACLRWNVRPNIETVSRADPEKAALLALVSNVMAGERDQALLDQVLERWP